MVNWILCRVKGSLSKTVTGRGSLELLFSFSFEEVIMCSIFSKTANSGLHPLQYIWVHTFHWSVKKIMYIHMDHIAEVGRCLKSFDTGWAFFTWFLHCVLWHTRAIFVGFYWCIIGLYFVKLLPHVFLHGTQGSTYGFSPMVLPSHIPCQDS